MKYLKTYNESSDWKKERDDRKNKLFDIAECFQDLIDEFGFVIPDYILSSPSHTNVSMSNRTCSINIDYNYKFSSDYSINGYHIRLRTHNSNTLLPRDEYYKGFDGIRNSRFRELLEEGHKTALSYSGSVDSLVGSWDSELDMFYFTKPPSYKKYNGLDIYGGNIIKELPIVGGYLQSDIVSHDNIFNYYDQNKQIGGLFACSGSMGFDRPLCIISGRDCDPYGKCTPNTPIEQWVSNEWEKVCDKYGIKFGMKNQKIHSKVNVPMFMNILGDNQEIFKSYKQLPKVNKSRF